MLRLGCLGWGSGERCRVWGGAWGTGRGCCVWGCGQPVGAGVLAQPRRAQAVGGRPAGEVDGVGNLPAGAAGTIEFDHRVEPQRGSEGERLVEGVDLAGRHAGIRQKVDPVRRGLEPKQVFERRLERLPVPHPVCIAAESVVVGEAGRPDQAHQGAELAVVADRDHQGPVGGVEEFVGRDARVRVAHPGRRLSGGEGARGLVGQCREQGGEQVHLHPVAGRCVRAGIGCVTGTQGEQDAAERVEPGEHVHEGDPHLARLLVRAAGDAHQPADRLHEQVIAGQSGAGAAAEARDRAVDDARVHGPQLVEAQTEALHHAGPEVLHHHVGGLGESPGHGQSRVGAEVADDAALVAVHRPEVGGVALRVDRREPLPGVVTGRALDLDHVGAEVGQHHGGVGPGQHPREVGDAQARQRLPGCVLRHDPPLSPSTRTTGPRPWPP